MLMPEPSCEEKGTFMHRDSNKCIDAEEKRRILAELNAKRLKEQRRTERFKKHFLKTRIYHIEGKEFYKLSDGKRAYFVEKEMLRKVIDGPKEMTLHTFRYASGGKRTGLAKWDPVSEQIMLSESALRVYFKPFKLEKIRQKKDR